MKGQLTTPEQRGTFLCMHDHEFVQDIDTGRIVRRLKVVPAPGQKVTARNGKREYIVGPRGNLIRQEGTHA